MSITQLQPFNLDSTASYTLGNVTVSGNITAGGGTVSPSVLVTNIQITDSSFTVLDDTAVSTSGGYIKITGSGFAAGTTVVIGSVSASSVAIVSSTVLNVQVPAQAAGTYTVYVVNTSGAVGIRVNGLNYSGTPTWTTTSPLTGGIVNTAISIQLAATGDAPLTYALQAGSTLPSGLSLSSSGLLSGTVTGITVTTTYNFTIVATDAQAQDTPQAFSITITSGDQYFDYTTLLLSANTPSSTFVTDASSNSFAITVNGDTRPNNFGPYTPGYYSNFFDGTGDYLRVASTGAGFSSLNIFTYECWIYPTAALSTNCIFDISESTPFRFVLSSTNVNWQGPGGGTILTANFTWVLGAWHHVAFVDDGTNISIFINGTRYATTTYGSWGSTGSGGVNIGCNRGDTWFFPGYISNARFVKGTAVYDPTQTTITVPTTPLTAVSGTSLLTCQSNRFIDNSADNLTVTRNGDVTVNSFDPFVPSSSTATLGSTYFDGTGDYLRSQLNSVNIRTAFTIEAWAYLTTTSGFVLFSASNTANVAGSNLYLNISGATIYLGDGVINNITFSSSLLVTNIWNHIAITFDGTTYRVFVNGTLAGSSTTLLANNTLNGIDIGARVNENLYITGYISNFRVVKGTAVYTATFTPPTSPLTAVSGTSLLTLQSNTPNNNNMFADNSSNNFLLTRNGNTTQGTFSPYTENWSNYFDGTSDSISYTGGSSLNFGTSDFTIETWAFLTNTGTFSAFIRPDDSGAFPEWGYDFSSSQLKFDARNGSIVSTSTSMPVNQWVHLAVSRSGTSLRQFVNGTQVGSTTTNSTNFGSTTGVIRIGGSSFSGSHSVNGYLSNFRVVKGTALYTTTFTPSTTPLQPIANTSLLTCADNRFIDDSPNNFTITRNGDVRVQKFGPFSSVTLPTPYYGAYFDGSGDYLSAANNSAIDVGTGAFTIEAWIYRPGNIGDSDWRLVGGSVSSSGFFGGRGTFSLGFGRSAVAWDLESASNAYSANTWTHVVYVRNSSNNLAIFSNGTRVATTTNSNNYGLNGGSIQIAAEQGSQFFGGYISNFRLVKGTAVYDPTQTTITVPTSPLTSISNTGLLTCQSATFIDNSTNNFTITANGNSQPTKYNPFTVSYSTLQSYSPSVFGGSMYFDGTGDYLSASGNAAFAMSTGNFTLEAWINPISISSYFPIITQLPALTTGVGYFFLGINSSRQIELYYDGQTYSIFSSTTVTLNTWNHVAIVRSGSTITGYINGVVAGTVTYSGIFGSSSTNLEIGARSSGNQWANGYISDARIVKGTAVYTSHFVPSNAPLTAVQNTVLLLNGTAGGIIDVSSNNNLESLGNSQISTSVKNYGNSSMYFDGTGDYLINTTNTNLYGAGLQFTAECWIYVTNTGVTSGIMACWNPTTGTTGWSITCTDKIKLTFGSQFFNSTWEYNNLGSISANTWTHIAFVRTQSGTDNVNSFFINGVSVLNAVDSLGTTRYTGSPANGNPFAVGGAPSLSSSRFTSTIVPMNGYIQDARITNGVARYTANFTPPSTPFIAYGN